MQVTGVEVHGVVQSIITVSTAVTAIGATIAKFIQTIKNLPCKLSDCDEIIVAGWV